MSDRPKVMDEETDQPGDKIAQFNEKLLAETEQRREQGLIDQIHGLKEERKEVTRRKQALDGQLAGGMLSQTILQHPTKYA